MTPQTVLTPTEAAAVAKVHVKTLYRWIDQGLLPATRINARVIRIKREDLDRLLTGDAA